MDDETVWRSQFEGLGVNQVRAKFTSLTGDLQHSASRWLAEKDVAALAAEEAYKREQMFLAQDARTSARTSNVIAIIALGVSVVAVVISIAR